MNGANDFIARQVSNVNQNRRKPTVNGYYSGRGARHSSYRFGIVRQDEKQYDILIEKEGVSVE
jgi:hypothetical protein